ncbi:hypothetical protein [Leifsonia poae]|uniref:hypothetical protein n=1 Tax=Leifsonia poae TaxID=110933 RepID=UPI001CBD8A04|nr:hypothetical protein [Leifsonia poae]
MTIHTIPLLSQATARVAALIQDRRGGAFARAERRAVAVRLRHQRTAIIERTRRGAERMRSGL